MNHLLRSSVVIISILFLSIFTLACQSKIERTHSNQVNQISYLALGDSYTIGTGIESDNSYPYQLAHSLSARGFDIDTTQIIATNGWTTTDLKNGIAEVNPDSSFDLVSLLIGVNNQYQGLDIQLYRTEFRELLEQAIVFAGGDTSQVFVISIPNYGVTPFAQSRNPDSIREELAEYDAIARNISSEYNIPFIDIRNISEMASDDASLLASDQLHPSAKMYSMWIEEMLPTVTRILND